MDTQSDVRGGFANVGNTCYMNAALKCMFSLSPFAEFVYSNTSLEPVISNIKELFTEVMLHNRLIRPYGFITALNRCIKSFSLLEQNDVHEFISILLECLTKECGHNANDKMLKVLREIEYANTSFDRQRQKMDKDWVTKVSKEYSKLLPMFYGQHICQIICNDCKKIWHNYEIYQNIFVSLDKDSLEQCLHSHFQDVPLPDWRCDKCQLGNGSSQTIMLWKNPQVFMITLKRFDYDQRIGNFVKNAKLIDIQEKLDFSGYTIGKTRVTYVLKAVAFHNGSYHGGHYHAVCKHANNIWYLHDDEHVIKMGSDMPDMSSGYVFFYLATSL